MKKRFLFDTDVVLDFLFERQPFCADATLALNLISQGTCNSRMMPVLGVQA